MRVFYLRVRLVFDAFGIAVGDDGGRLAAGGLITRRTVAAGFDEGPGMLSAGARSCESSRAGSEADGVAGDGLLSSYSRAEMIVLKLLRMTATKS